MSEQPGETITPWCPCGHGEDDLCLNGVIYESCGDENCGGSCSDEGGQCRSLPGCCASADDKPGDPLAALGDGIADGYLDPARSPERDGHFNRDPDT